MIDNTLHRLQIIQNKIEESRSIHSKQVQYRRNSTTTIEKPKIDISK